MLAFLDTGATLKQVSETFGEQPALWLSNVLEMMAGGGFVMWPLVVLGALLWYALGVRAATLRRGSPFPLSKMVSAAASNPEKDGSGVIGKAVATAVRIATVRPRNLERRLDEALIPYEREIKRFESLATAIVMVAPLLGLLGTVGGMIETFSALGDMALFTQSGGIAGGISQALLTTQMGLVVAIPGLLVGRILGRKAQKLEGELQQVKECLLSSGALEGAA
jgi:biopolymer transport protein ExbB